MTSYVPPSMYIRNLGGQKGALADPKTLPPGQVLLNPSAAGDWVCLRCIRQKTGHEMNSMVLANERTGEQREIPSPLSEMPATRNSYRGLEDVRLVEHQGRLWFSATATHATADQQSALVVGLFDVAVTRVEEAHPVSVGALPAKNLCPFSHDGRLLLLDTYHHRVYEVVEEFSDKPTDGPENAPKKRTGLRADLYRELVPGPGLPTAGYRGSTSPVHLHGNTWGCVVHAVVFLDNTRQVSKLAYYHLWLEFDLARGAITFLSTPFFLAQHGIEFVSGIRARGPAIELFFGVSDQVAMVCKTTLYDLRCQK